MQQQLQPFMALPSPPRQAVPQAQLTGHSVPVVSLAATIESFYRSAMNSMINQTLTRHKGPLFPRMHIQMPTRVVYINGFKGIRHALDTRTADMSLSLGTKLALACTPGVIMTPISSILEACNATLNTEPLLRRATRGFRARTGREVIFGIGLNQLSDHCKLFAPAQASPHLKAAIGSMLAGVVAAFLSHVPHNMSTLKLMNPSKSYPQHFADFIKPWHGRLQTVMPGSPLLAARLAPLLSVLAPTGLATRTLQIVGSFVVLNSIITALTPHAYGAAASAQLLADEEEEDVLG